MLTGRSKSAIRNQQIGRPGEEQFGKRRLQFCRLSTAALPLSRLEYALANFYQCTIDFSPPPEQPFPPVADRPSATDPSASDAQASERRLPVSEQASERASVGHLLVCLLVQDRSTSSWPTAGCLSARSAATNQPWRAASSAADLRRTMTELALCCCGRRSTAERHPASQRYWIFGHTPTTLRALRRVEGAADGRLFADSRRSWPTGSARMSLVWITSELGSAVLTGANFARK